MKFDPSLLSEFDLFVSFYRCPIENSVMIRKDAHSEFLKDTQLRKNGIWAFERCKFSFMNKRISKETHRYFSSNFSENFIQQLV